MSALGTSSLVDMLCGDYHAAQWRLEELIALATERNLQGWIDWANGYLGCVLIWQGAFAKGIATLEQAATKLQEGGAKYAIEYSFAVLAYGYIQNKQYQKGMQLIQDTLAEIDPLRNNSNGRAAVIIETSHIIGEALFAADHNVEAEAYFLQTISFARQVSAKSRELRAAIHLCRIWRCQNKVEQARELLSNVYGWFTEGFDTKDLQEAKLLLDELSG